MATFVLIHGGGSSSWDWHLVVPKLEEAGHRAIAVDLPVEEPGLSLVDYADSVSAQLDEARGDSSDGDGQGEQLVIVGHSLGGFTAALVAERLDADGLVYVAGMIPKPGETMQEWWDATGHSALGVDSEDELVFYNLVPDDLVVDAKAHVREETGSWMDAPWPGLGRETSTGFIAAEDDLFFPIEFAKQHARDRAGVEAVVVPGGHYVAIGAPDPLAKALAEFADGL
ncbi:MULTISPECIES: alpha/beta fold hydrolase [unclassified Pseudoclavibacter]|uniref:alpha/beta fold hydrolase n=1 Tax=unclassified Pseudoclavibacter TaxID=2615177 RepID=UPI001BA56D87|nr:alpha/beta hydrolase [Pseudoclavibacter sp. Marseille-Q4354]MBS3180461.1 alpha/beta hydrolase [Pseudoclavibacter sp. Marseille-Q4354]